MIAELRGQIAEIVAGLAPEAHRFRRDAVPLIRGAELWLDAAGLAARTARVSPDRSATGPHRGPGQAPRTLVGQWLRAMTLAQHGLANRLNQDLERSGSLRPERRAPADSVVHEAFTLVVRRRFAADTGAREIADWITDVREFQKSHRMSVAAGTALVRAAFGQPVPTDDISLSDAYLCRVSCSWPPSTPCTPSPVLAGTSPNSTPSWSPRSA